MNRLIIQCFRVGVALLGFALTNVVLLALVAALDLIVGATPLITVPAILLLLIVVFALAAVKGIKTAPQDDGRQARALADEQPAARSTVARQQPRFLSAIVIRRKSDCRVTNEERKVYSEATF
jgi:hypothetical protein